MNRRRLLQIGGTALAVGVAGCSNDGTPDDAPTEMPRPELGNSDNPTLQLFEDMGCPACRQFKTAIFPQLFREFIEGDVLHFEHYDFVLPADSFSMEAAMGARAVQDLVGMTEFWQYTSQIHDNQNLLDTEFILDTAEDVGADRSTVEERIDNRYYSRVIENDKEYGESNGVSATPAFVINGERQLDLDIQNYSSFRSQLTQEL